MFITFLSDFGLQDDFVGTCHGVIKRDGGGVNRVADDRLNRGAVNNKVFQRTRIARIGLNRAHDAVGHRLAVENNVAAARAIYNSNARRYNDRIQSIPAVLFIGAFGFRALPYVEAAAAERGVGRVDFA